MSTHFHVGFDAGLTRLQMQQVIDKYKVFHTEHLEAIETGLGDWNAAEVHFCGPSMLHIEFEDTTSSIQDRRVPHLMMRYFELSIIPIVFFDEDVKMLFEFHDEELDEEKGPGCIVCRDFAYRLMPADINSTAPTYNESIGA